MTAIKLFHINHPIKPFFFPAKFLGNEHIQRSIGIIYIGGFPMQIYINWAAEFWVRQKLRHIDIRTWVESIISEHHQIHLHINLLEIREELQAAVNSGFLCPSHLMNADSWSGQKEGLQLFVSLLWKTVKMYTTFSFFL